MGEAGVPAAVSYTAGTYVCNDIMYHLLHLLAAKYPHIQGGFIHIPYSCEQVKNRSAGMPSLPLGLMAEGLEIAARTVGKLLEEGTGDRKEATGFLS
jgi:pyroglutamyl-peptidase